MEEIMPVTTIVAFLGPPIGLIVAIVCYYIFSSQED